jgi:hypothetical protein
MIRNKPKKNWKCVHMILLRQNLIIKINSMIIKIFKLLDNQIFMNNKIIIKK